MILKLAAYEIAAENPDYCFPSSLRKLVIRKDALAATTGFVSCILSCNCCNYMEQYREMQNCWKKSSVIDKNYHIPFRNLAIAYYNDRQPETALDCLSMHCL